MKEGRFIELFKDYRDQVRLTVYEWLRRSDLRSAIVIFVLLSIVVAFISLPDTYTLNLPVSPNDVGKVMKFSIRSDRDYRIADEEETRKRRIKAESEVPDYYNYIDNSIYYGKVRGAFSMMRGLMDDLIVERIRKDARVPEAFAGLYLQAVKANIDQEPFSEIREEVQRVFQGSKNLFDREIGMSLDHSVFELLREAWFDERIEKAVFSLINRLESYYIYKNPLGEEYALDHIMVQRGEAMLQIGLNRVINQNSLIPEIEHDQKLLGHDKLFSEKGKTLVKSFAYWIVRDNINFSSKLTEKKKLEVWNNVPDTVFQVKSGEVLRRAGEIITERDIRIFTEMVKQAGERSLLSLFIQNMLFILCSALILFFAFRKSVSKFSDRNKDLILISFQCLLTYAFWYMIESLSIPFSQWMGNIDARIFYFLLPVPFVIATVRLLVNTETALFFLLFMLFSLLPLFPDNFYFPVYYSIGSLFYIFLITHIEKRSTILRISFTLALLLMLMTLLIFSMDFTLPDENIFRALFISFIGAIFSGILLMGVIPMWEWLLGYTTDITFLEFSTLNHPLMKKMAVYANGTYQHSLTVGSIVEAAAREIGLSPLACKVMAYFHDIGKTDRPEYFSENQGGVNKHDELSATMSAMIIINHVKRGGELAKEYNLGEKIEDAVCQHQGTSLIKYFYAKAKAQDAEVDEVQFRYPGPKPQTREAGLLMLADSIEAAVRSMPDKNYQKISDAVGNIMNKIIDDGQLSECNMTMKDLALIKKSFIKTLSGIYHARIEYPDPVA